MVGKKNIRDYEVSIWTLQDSFITVLKQSNLENKEKIQEPKMTLKDDGEYTFSFKIPMYLQEDSDLTEKPYFKRERIWKENPIWYTVHNGNLMVNLRKVKVIFNKKSSDEEVFEFIINKITERHEGYSKICEVDCDGLAFHELGKQGYEIELSGAIYDAEYQEWDESDNPDKGEAPIENINYWIEKVLKNSNWGYIINMDWSIYDGIVEENYNGNIIDNKKYLNMTDEDRKQFNNNRENNGLRRKDTVYKSPYVASWQIEENKILADTIIDDLSELEERKTVEGKESNRYNLLQTIAETFQVFCKFKYEYDDNYHIIGRKVIFYNNFINESEGIIDFNYSYNTDEITREMESSDLVTKMYIKSLKDIGTLSGEISIRDSEANPSYEDFILNFDYLYQIGTISQEQYDEIKVFQTGLRKINIDINNKNAEILNYENQKSEAEIKESYAKELKDEADDRVTEAGDFFKAIAGDNPNIGRTATNPLMLLVIHNSKKPGGAYSTLTQEYGDLYTSTFALYKKVDENDAVITGSKIKSSDIHFGKDSDGFIKTISYPKEGVEGYVYATFQYNPNTPAEKIKKIWNIKKAQAELDEEEAQQTLADIDKALNGDDEINPPTIGLYKEVEQKYNERRELIAKFEKMMGPALREGNWQPEDEYADNVKNCVLNLGTFPFSNADSNDKANFIWDNQIMPNSEEQKLTYSEGINDIKYYPCVLLTNAEWTALHNAENVNYIYRDIYLSAYNDEHPMADEKVNHYLAIGSTNGCDFAFLRDKNNQEIIPALILLGAENILDAEVSGRSTPVSVFEQLQQNARIVSITTNENTGNITEGSNLVNLTNKLISPAVVKERYELVYPRVKISSKNYLVNLPDSKIYKNNEPLYINESYYDLYHNNYNYITLKNIDLNKNYSCHYAFTTAPDAVYLDGVKILKENSVPKTSYTIKPIAIDNSIIKNAYNSVGQLAHINDHELKFKNVQGYISEVELDLDKPWEDNYTIKNYKTKFEDLFSTIVAQTESMKKNSQIFSMASNAFDANGYLTAEMVDNIQNRLSIPTSNVYVPSPAEIYGQYASAIRQQLKDAFDEAGEVLVAAQNSVGDVNGLNLENAAILNNFKSSLADSLKNAAIDINKKAGYINIYAVNPQNKNTSLLKIDNEKGIYLGSNKSITFYSEDVNATGSAASALISKDRILFGVTNGINGSAVDLTKDYIVFGSSFINNEGTPSTNNIGAATGIAGVKITRNSIEMATGTYSTNANENTRNYIAMNDAGIKIANSKNEGKGAIVTINQSGVLIGVANKASNFITKIQARERVTDNNNATFQVYAPNFVVTAAGKLYAYDAYISGTIYSGAGQIGGWNIGSNYIGDGTSRETSTIAISNYGDIRIWAGATGIPTAQNGVNASTTKFYVTKEGALYSTSGAIGGWNIISNQIRRYIPADQSPDGKEFNIYMSSNYYTDTNQIPYNPVFAVKYDNDWKFYVRSNGVLFAKEANITGTITATSLVIRDNGTDKNASTYFNDIINGKGYATTSQMNSSLANYMKTVDFVTTGGIIKGEVLKTTTNGKTVISGTLMELDADGALKFASLSGTGDIAKLTMSGSNIILSSSNGTLGDNKLKITATGISISTGGSFFVVANSNKFLINSSNADDNPNLYIANNATWSSATSGIRYSASNGLSIKGSITATSGYIGGSTGWKISSNYLYSASLSGNNWSNFSGDGIVLFSNNTYSEIHMYKDGNNLLNINTDASGETFALAFGDYSHSKNYFAYTANGQLIIDGKLNATSGTFQNVKITGTTVIDTQGSVKISGSYLKFQQDSNNGLFLTQDATNGCNILLSTKSSSNDLGTINLEEGLIKLTSNNSSDSNKGAIILDAKEIVLRWNAGNATKYRIVVAQQEPSYTCYASGILWFDLPTGLNDNEWHNVSVKYKKFN